MDEELTPIGRRRGRWHDRLIDCLDSPDATFRFRAVALFIRRSVGRVNDGLDHRARLGRLHDVLSREPDRDVRQMLYIALGALSPDEDALRDALSREPDRKVRRDFTRPAKPQP